MKWFSVLMIAILALVWTAPAFACETTATAKPDSDCVVMPRGEIRGVWFRLDKADELRAAWLESPELRLQLQAYKELVAIRDSQLAGYREATTARKGAADDMLKANLVLTRDAARAREDRDRALAERDAWYRSPLLWTGVGVVLTVAAGATAAYTLR